jgi:SpoIID/LytB domain protein
MRRGVTLAVVCVLCAMGAGGRAQTGIRIGVLSGGTYAVTVVPLDTYVARVLAGEAAPNTAPAALEALAIAVRTYTAANMAKHRAEGFDLCDQTHCQVMRTANPATERASTATAGLVLLDGRVPATIYYSASCGGRTELPSEVWPQSQNPSYLPSRDDEACRGFPAWSAELTAADLQRALAAAGMRGTLRDMRIASRNGSGRVNKLALEGMTPSEISGQDLRMAVGPTLGWMRVLSANFDLRRVGTVYRFTGHGSGHGVGMCVIGAMHRAEDGQTAAQILSQYYPGLRIAPYTPAPPPVVTTSAAPPPSAPKPATPAAALGTAATPASSNGTTPPAIAEPRSARADMALTLATADAAAQTEVESLLARARDDLARTLGVEPPAKLTATFYPTAAAYEQASGHPWFTSGAVVDGAMHFLPVGVLRDRGVLDRTLRRALVTLLVGGSLDGRPAWVREGVAGYFADPEAPVVEVRNAGCPPDVELTRPLSAGALSDAYGRARACVARQIAGGRQWRDLR